MLNFLNSFPNFSSQSSENHHQHHHRIHHRRFRSMDSGLNLIVGADFHTPENILESVSVKPIIRRNKNKKNSNYCFLDEISGCGNNGFNGLRSCTESLGFESSDQMENEAEEDEIVLMRSMKSIRNVELRRWKRSVDRDKKRDELMEDKKKKKVFPPPLSTMNPNGQPNFFLKPVRKDGRLELTEVRINRPDSILRASRQDGRLRLHFVVPKVIKQQEEEEIKEEEEEIQEEESKIQEEEEESRNVRELNTFRLTTTATSSSSTTGEGFRRCHELGNHHHHHLNMWNQHNQVTTRSTVHVL